MFSEYSENNTSASIFAIFASSGTEEFSSSAVKTGVTAPYQFGFFPLY